jgi:hypothetical protein
MKISLVELVKVNEFLKKNPQAYSVEEIGQGCLKGVDTSAVFRYCNVLTELGLVEKKLIKPVDSMFENWFYMHGSWKNKTLMYKLIKCETCMEETSHVQVDTTGGTKYSCELCGRYESETIEQYYVRMKRR